MDTDERDTKVDWTVKVCPKCGRKYKITEIHYCPPDSDILEEFKQMFGL